ncbi:hypothetical protein JYT51_01075, partial [Candidatus Amoebophilus asiaticus]|nr:hypothetical protein [Candidatus Amoebophilus asiaticus]
MSIILKYIILLFFVLVAFLSSEGANKNDLSNAKDTLQYNNRNNQFNIDVDFLSGALSYAVQKQNGDLYGLGAGGGLSLMYFVFYNTNHFTSISRFSLEAIHGE